jgi:DNA-binding response OmpR family regulator
MESNARSSSPSPAASVRVLVVEDDQPTGHALRLLLRHHRYDVVTVNTVAHALEELSRGPAPDAVLLDLMLPDGDGLRVLEAIRSRGLRSQVTVVTGVGDAERLDHALKLQPKAVLQKPVEFPQILKQLPPVA